MSTVSAPSALPSLLREHVLSVIRAVPVKYKILIVDGNSLKLLNSVLTLAAMGEEGVLTVEDVSTRPRCRYPTRDVLYVITATDTSINGIIEDWWQQPVPFASAHILTTNALTDEMMERLKTSNAFPYIKTLKEMGVDWWVQESRVFTLDAPISNSNVYYSEGVRPSLLQYELDIVASKLLSFFITLGMEPSTIRYYGGASNSDGGRPNRCAVLSAALTKALARYSRRNPGWNRERRFRSPILVLLDRTFDPMSPFVHDFGYQSLLRDMLRVKYRVKIEKEVILNDSDPVWRDMRHFHIANVIEKLSQGLRDFTANNAAAQFEKDGLQNEDASLNMSALKATISSLPEYQAIKAAYSLHTRLCSDVMKAYTDSKIEPLVDLEQDLATSSTADGKTLKFSSHLPKILDCLRNSDIGALEKLRLVCIYVIARKGISDKERCDLLEAGNFSVQESQVVTNLSMLNVRISETMFQKLGMENAGTYDYSMLRKRNTQNADFDNFRHVPSLKFLLDDIISGTLDLNAFPAADFGEGGVLARGAGGGESGSQSSNPGSGLLSKTKPSWATKRAVGEAQSSPSVGGRPSKANDTPDHRQNGPAVIIFMMGGFCLSELRVAHDVAKSSCREVYLGHNHDISPQGFLSFVAGLHKDPYESRPRLARDSTASKSRGPSERFGSMESGMNSRQSGSGSGSRRSSNAARKKSLEGTSKIKSSSESNSTGDVRSNMVQQGRNKSESSSKTNGSNIILSRLKEDRTGSRGNPSESYDRSREPKARSNSRDSPSMESTGQKSGGFFSFFKKRSN